MSDKKDNLSFEEKVKREININLDVNEEIGEENILYFNIMLSKRDKDVIPTFTLIKKDEPQAMIKLTKKTHKLIDKVAIELVKFINGNVSEETDTVSM